MGQGIGDKVSIEDYKGKDQRPGRRKRSVKQRRFRQPGRHKTGRHRRTDRPRRLCA